MTGAEKYLYHQIHPLKLLADIGAGLASLYPLWRHELVLALVVMFVPPAVASFLLMRFADLEPQKNSAFGAYVARYMTRGVEAVRLAGMVVMAVGAWYRSFPLIAAGAAVIILAWLRGVMAPGKLPRSP
jgi:hypothetical protein